MTRRIAFALTLFAALPLFAASDVLTIGTLAAPRGTVAAVPVYVRDVGGSPLGMDQSAANRIQGVGFKVTYSPASAVSAVTFTRAGVLQGLTPLYETVLTPPGSVGYVGSFAQSSNPIPFVLNAATPGNLIGYLNLTIPQSVSGGTTITLTVDAAGAALSNQAGTVIETGNNGKLAVANGAVNVTAAASGAVRGDFNGNGKSDLWWRSTSNGDDYIWYTSATAFAGGDTPPPVNTGYVFIGTGDFNNDGRADVLWRNSSTGEISIWFMNGGTIAGGLSLPWVANAQYVIAGIGDFNADGYADILWRNTSNGSNSVWYITASGFAGGVNVPAVADTNLAVAAVADFNGDGRADIFWRNTTSGANYIWLMNGGNIIGGTQLPTIPNTYVMAGTGDFNADGTFDLLWRSPSTGSNSVWYINNGAFIGGGLNLPTVGGAYSIVAVGDFNGDGSYDLMWRNPSTGENSIWFINSNGLQGGIGLPYISGSILQIVAPK